MTGTSPERVVRPRSNCAFLSLSDSSSARASLQGPSRSAPRVSLAGHRFMPCRRLGTLNPDRSAAILTEAIRRVDASIPDREVDLGALRQALETELGKGPRLLVELTKVGRRRALDRIRRVADTDPANVVVRGRSCHPNG